VSGQELLLVSIMHEPPMQIPAMGWYPALVWNLQFHRDLPQLGSFGYIFSEVWRVSTTMLDAASTEPQTLAGFRWRSSDFALKI
jgi:hypothetical protein